MSAKVRIIVKSPEVPPADPNAAYPRIVRQFADYADVQIEVTSPKGEKFNLWQVRSIKIDMNDKSSEPIEATLRVMVDELDIECRAALFPEETK